MKGNIMSHEVETMAFAGEVPWHGLGKPVTNDLSPLEMMQAAGADWEVALTQNHYPPDHAVRPSKAIDNSHFIERLSDGRVLGEYVAGDYKPVQNLQLFEFFQEFIDDGSMFLHTAGVLSGGKKVWCMATTKEAFSVGSNDEVVNNLLFTISHTGKHSNSALNTPVRVVCANTMRMAFLGADDIVTHNHRAIFDAEALKVALGASSQEFGELEKVAKAMARKVHAGEEEIEYFRTVFGGKERETDSGKIIQSEGVRKAMAYFRGQEFVPLSVRNRQATKDETIAKLNEKVQGLLAGKTVEQIEGDRLLVSEKSEDINPGWNLEGSEGTLWGAYNTVTYMVDHKPVRDFGDDQRLNNAFYGNATRDPKLIAYNKAKELIAA